MLSSKYHAFSWAAATVATVSYRGITSIFGRSVEFYSQMLLLPHLLHGMYTIWKGPATSPRSQLHRAADFLATCILLISLGSVSHLVHTGDHTLPGFGCFVHACLAFIAFGTRQAVEQNVSWTLHAFLLLLQTTNLLSISLRGMTSTLRQ